MQKLWQDTPTAALCMPRHGSLTQGYYFIRFTSICISDIALDISHKIISRDFENVSLSTTIKAELY